VLTGEAALTASICQHPGPPEAGPARTLDANIGYSTGEGLRVEGVGTSQPALPEGARASPPSAALKQSASIRFRRSNSQRDRALILQLEAGRQITGRCTCCAAGRTNP
jgi:hypothetical protein